MARANVRVKEGFFLHFNDAGSLLGVHDGSNPYNRVVPTKEQEEQVGIQ
jgi:hypothetical protein